jgi:plasmid maintenance system antidote protein VapI
MKLSAYLEREGVKPSQFAYRLGVEPSTITRLLSGERSCSLDMAIRIEEATDGEVAPRELIQLEPPTKEAAE